MSKDKQTQKLADVPVASLSVLVCIALHLACSAAGKLLLLHLSYSLGVARNYESREGKSRGVSKQKHKARTRHRALIDATKH